jgi:hypothetical protein
MFFLILSAIEMIVLVKTACMLLWQLIEKWLKTAYALSSWSWLWKSYTALALLLVMVLPSVLERLTILGTTKITKFS